MNLVNQSRSRQVILSNNLPALFVRSLVVASIAILSGCQATPEYQIPNVVSERANELDGENQSSSRNLNAENSSVNGLTYALSDQTLTIQHATRMPWLSTIDADFAVARNLVENELNTDLSQITLQVVDNTPINAEVALETQRLINRQFGTSEFADQFLDQVMEPLDGTYAAVYSSRLGAVLISHSMLAGYENSLPPELPESSRRAALLTLLIHELVHAADDLRYNIHDNRALNFRASFAQSATFEGHAQWVTRRICKKVNCSEGLDALDNFMFSTNLHSPQLTQPVEAISRSVLEYSYVEGERFITQLAARSNGDQLIDDLLHTPPLDPIQILAPETFPDVARENRNQQLIRASRNVDHPLSHAPWVGVETSPLKGVDLRADPARRQAAIDGFTRLIKGMISMQFYDQGAIGAMPIEATLLKAESAHTARLFANMLHSNTHQSGARVNDESLQANDDAGPHGAGIELHIYRTAIDADISYRTTIAVAGKHVVQVSGNTTEQDFLDDYAIRVLLNLSETEFNDS